MKSRQLAADRKIICLAKPKRYNFQFIISTDAKREVLVKIIL
jgi:hypothetical protein